MADWFDIQDSQVDPDAPLTSELAYAWKDNVIAAFEGAPGAPRLVYGAGTIGGFIFARRNASGTVSFDSVVAGSMLTPSNVYGASAGGSVSGSWRCLGSSVSTIGPPDYTDTVTLWQRIS